MFQGNMTMTLILFCCFHSLTHTPQPLAIFQVLQVHSGRVVKIQVSARSQKAETMGSRKAKLLSYHFVKTGMWDVYKHMVVRSPATSSYFGVCNLLGEFQM